MGVRERKVEHYLRDRVKEIGGLSRKWGKSNVAGVPDQLVFLRGSIYLVEIKTTDGVLEPEQKREHARMADVLIEVYTLYGHRDIDEWVKKINERT